MVVQGLVLAMATQAVQVDILATEAMEARRLRALAVVAAAAAAAVELGYMVKALMVQRDQEVLAATAAAGAREG